MSLLSPVMLLRVLAPATLFATGAAAAESPMDAAMNSMGRLMGGKGYDVDQLAEIKQCLAGDASALPGVTPAQPPVRFGNVLGSYGGPDLYGPNGYDYTYPQYYNLGKRLTDDAEVLLQGASPYFPIASAQACLDGATGSIEVVDVDSNGAYPAPKIPCFDQKLVQNVYTTTSDGSSGADPVLASAYVAYLMTQYPPISNTVELGGSEVFITFSGEPAMLGSPGWTLDKINQFQSQLQSNFASLKAQVPSLFPTGGTDPDTIKYAIWNFDQMLDAISLP